MSVAPLSRAFRGDASGPPTAKALDEEAMKIGAAMAWIKRWGNLDDFPSSRTERIALMTTAVRRGLVAWDRWHDRYKLTQLGKMQLASYLPKIKAAPKTARNSRRLFDRFERRPYAMIVAFFAIGAVVGAAAALTSAGDPSDTRSPLSASLQTFDGSSAPAAPDTLGAPGSQMGSPQKHPNTVDVSASRPASLPASPRHDGGVNAEGARESIGSQQTKEVDQPLPVPQDERKPAATISGSVASARPAGHFDRDPSVESAERSASTDRPVEPRAAAEIKPVVSEAKPKPANHHRGGAARAQRLHTLPEQDWGHFWSQQVDDHGRLTAAPRVRRDVSDDPTERWARRYHQRWNVAPTTREDNMGPVGWLFR